MANMGIYKEQYRKFEGKVQGRAGRIYTIFYNEFTRRLKNRWALALLLLAWGISLIPILTGSDIFAYFILSFIWLLLFTAVVGGPILAEDVQYNNITLYLSRPLQKLDYFFGKYLTLFGLISLLALLPNLVIAALLIGTNYNNPNNEFDYMKVAYTFIGVGVIMTFVFTNIGMAFSSLTNNHKYASGGIFAFIFFSNIMAIALSGLNEYIMYLSIWMNFMIIFTKWIGESGDGFLNMEWEYSIGILVLISLVCLFIIFIKIRKVELSE